MKGGARRVTRKTIKKKGGYAVEGRVQRQSVISGASGSTLRVANRVEERWFCGAVRSRGVQRAIRDEKYPWDHDRQRREVREDAHTIYAIVISSHTTGELGKQSLHLASMRSTCRHCPLGLGELHDGTVCILNWGGEELHNIKQQLSYRRQLASCGFRVGEYLLRAKPNLQNRGKTWSSMKPFTL